MKSSGAGSFFPIINILILILPSFCIGFSLIFRGMTRKRIGWICLLILVAFIKFFSLFPDAVERYYSQGVYLYIAAAQRQLFGWLPFSIGDLLYATAVIYLCVLLIKLIKRVRQKTITKRNIPVFARRLFATGLLLYALFNLLWGLNYNRRGIAQQLQLKGAAINHEDLLPLMQLLQEKINALAPEARRIRPELASHRQLFGTAIQAYDSLAHSKPYLTYRHPSVKPSLFSYLGNYLGYTGYYNPFTGEAQVNTTVPLLLQPYTTCHEIGHQLGYARENEANFAGYLAARTSRDPAFRYSVYFDLYSYGRYYLYWQDSSSLKKLDSTLSPLVKADRDDLKRFLERHKNPVEQIIDKAYSQFLRANEQPAGKISYNEVVLWMLAYYRKYGKEAI